MNVHQLHKQPEVLAKILADAVANKFVDQAFRSVLTPVLQKAVTGQETVARNRPILVDVGKGFFADITHVRVVAEIELAAEFGCGLILASRRQFKHQRLMMFGPGLAFRLVFEIVLVALSVKPDLYFGGCCQVGRNVGLEIGGRGLAGLAVKIGEIRRSEEQRNTMLRVREHACDVK